jgi:hypothetical protein
MERATSLRPIIDSKNKIECYELDLGILKQPLFILGPYNAKCGGLDGIPDVNDHIRLLHRCASYGHVFYEGLLGSEYYGRIGKESEQYAGDHVFAFLDTPIELCVSRVKQRRLDRGVTKPLDETNTRGRVKKIERLKYRLDHEFNRRTVVINHIRAVPDVLALYLEAE